MPAIRYCDPNPEAVRARLEALGAARLAFDSYEQSIEFLKSLGRTIKRARIAVTPEKKGKLFGSEAMTLHTDHWLVDYIAWYCNHQSDVGGDSIILDARPIIESFDRHRQSALQSIDVTVPPLRPGEPRGVRRLLSDRGVYYADWLVKRDQTVEQTAALEDFERRLNVADEYRVNLVSGDVLIIDNTRMLHGRSAITNLQTQRELFRHWLVRN